MKILSAVFATVLMSTALTSPVSAGLIYDDKIWTLDEILAYPDVTVPHTILPGTISAVGTPTWGVPSRTTMLSTNGIEGYSITDGAKGRWVLVPVGDGTFKSLDFNALPPPPVSADPQTSFYDPGTNTVTLPNGQVLPVDLANSRIKLLPGGGSAGMFVSPTTSRLQTAAVPEPGTIGLLLGGGGLLALMARRRR